MVKYINEILAYLKLSLILLVFIGLGGCGKIGVEGTTIPKDSQPNKDRQFEGF